MTPNSQCTGMREVGLDHEFLDYQIVEAHVVFGLLWQRRGQIDSSVFSEGLSEDAQRSTGWLSPLIHERVIGNLGAPSEEASWIGAYQPSFVFQQRCLEKSANVGTDGEKPSTFLIVPLAVNVPLPLKNARIEAAVAHYTDVKICPVSISWTVRLFQTGAGTFTLRVRLNDLERITARAERFSRIHWMLRLTPNMDETPEGHSAVLAVPNSPVARTFLFVSHLGTFRLSDLMRHYSDMAFKELPRPPFRESEAERAPKHGIALDPEPLAFRRHPGSPLSHSSAHADYSENQSPFVFVTAVVSPQSIAALKASSPMTAKEIASIAARLTLDNRNATQTFQFLSEDYLSTAFAYDSTRDALSNLSHDTRLFYTFCRRGAIALTASPSELAAIFVVPSLLNLFETLMARLFQGVILNAQLARLADRATIAMEADGDDPVHIEEYARLRRSVALNLQNPLEYLFDGGAVTELALRAEEALFVREVWENVRQCFMVVDSLITDFAKLEFQRKYGE